MQLQDQPACLVSASLTVTLQEPLPELQGNLCVAQGMDWWAMPCPSRPSAKSAEVPVSAVSSSQGCPPPLTFQAVMTDMRVLEPRPFIPTLGD